MGYWQRFWLCLWRMLWLRYGGGLRGGRGHGGEILPRTSE